MLRIWRHKVKIKHYWNDKEIIICNSGEKLNDRQ